MTFKDILYYKIWNYVLSNGIVLLGKSDPPPAPDYTGAANATAAGNLKAAQVAAQANRVNQVTPNGNLTYSTNMPNDPLNTAAQWTATQTLSPQQQLIADQTNQLNLGLNKTANAGLDYANNVLSQPGVDQSKLASTGINPGQSYQDAMMARLQPQIDRENQQSDASLANQGITQGSEAYKNAKTMLSQQHNDLLNNATTTGMNMGLAANQQGFNQSAYNQMQPINVINALRTGSQVSTPNYINPAQQQTTQGADLLGAAQSQYGAALGNTNAQNAQSSGLTSGLFSLGSAALMSDRRLKENIIKVGKLDNGLNLYSYTYKLGHDLPLGGQVGVMADEVEPLFPNAIVHRVDGYKMVNYGELL